MFVCDLPKLRYLKLEGPSGSVQLAELADFLDVHSLTTFEIAGASEDDDIYSWRYSYDDLMDNDEDDEDDDDFKNSLETVRLIDSRLSETGFEQLCELCQGPLKVFEYNHVGPIFFKPIHVINHLMKHSSTLTRLKFNLLEGRYPGEPDDVAKWCGGVHGLVCLKELEIEQGILIKAASGGESESRLSHLVPHSIQELILGRCNESISRHLIELCSRHSDFPDLKKIKISFVEDGRRVNLDSIKNSFEQIGVQLF